MLQQIKRCVGVGTLLLSIPSVALAQATPLSVPPVSETTLPSDQSSTSPTSRIEPPAHPIAQESPEAVPPACPANQFASKFPDVTPYDWAYEAVNRLASGPLRCFPLPSNR